MWRAWVDRVSANLAFFPPPASYSIEQADGQAGAGAGVGAPLRLVSTTELLSFDFKVMHIKTRPTARGKLGREETLVAAFVPYQAQRSSPLGEGVTLLCSHGNAVDLGQMLPLWRELSRLLKVNIMGYDYAGYGCSTGTPTASQTFADIQAVYDHLVKEMGIPPSRIILYGQSVGSGPTCWLGAQEPGLGGVVLHSPLLSGVRVLHPKLSWWPAFADVFPNHVHVPEIQAPVLIMHGTEDEVIDISCAQRLAKLAKQPFPPLWAKGFNHQNIESCPNYLPTLLNFISHATTHGQQPPKPGL